MRRFLVVSIAVILPCVSPAWGLGTEEGETRSIRVKKDSAMMRYHKSYFFTLASGEVGREGQLHEVFPPVEVAGLLALGDESPNAGRGVEGGNPGAAGPHPLRQRALGHKLHFDLALPVGPLEGVWPGRRAGHGSCVPDARER